MNFLTARAGADLRQIHSSSFRTQNGPAVNARSVNAPAVTARPATGPIAWLARRLAERRAAATLRAELESLGDTALADLGLSREGIAAHVRQAMAQRKPAVRAQSPAELSEHLLADIAVQLQQGRARVYTDVPLGVITRGPVAGLPANVERLRRTA